jgi:hypothetical protein
VVLTLGAGDVTLLAPEVLAQLADLHPEGVSHRDQPDE